MMASTLKVRPKRNIRKKLLNPRILEKLLQPSRVLPFSIILFFFFSFVSWTHYRTLDFKRQVSTRILGPLRIKEDFYPLDSSSSISKNNKKNINDNDKNNNKVTVSLVILALKNVTKLSRLLNSIESQSQDFDEVMILDISCNPQTAHLMEETYPNVQDKMHVKYSRQCDSHGFSRINQSLEMTSKTSKWTLFLNENIILQDSTFINDLLKFGESQPKAGAVGCKLLNRSGDRVFAAGNIIWSDGSATGFGLDNTNINSSEFSYPRTVDYMPGACLLVKTDILFEYGGFDTNYFNEDYQFRDLQMYVQHTLGKDIWYRPESVAFYDNSGSPIDTDEMLLLKSRHIFQDKWKLYLTKHSLAPHMLMEDDKEFAILRASDLRARDSSKANILYIDAQIPNVSMGSGYVRAFDNLSTLASLENRITVLSFNLVTNDMCDEVCLRKIRDLGIEVVTDSWNDFLEQRGSFYEVIIVSRPRIFKATHKKLRELYKKSPFTLIYSFDALWYRHEEMMFSLFEQGIKIPSIADHKLKIRTLKMITETKKKDEQLLISMADMVVPVSEEESDLISAAYPNVQVEAVGLLNDNKKPTTSFRDRQGILYLASFDGKMLNNGDAIWYFLKEIYPLVLDEVPAPISLTIAGRKIPDEIRSFTKTNGIDQFVKFVDSPENVTSLYEEARIFIVPNLYGAGVQFKVSKSSILLYFRYFIAYFDH